MKPIDGGKLVGFLLGEINKWEAEKRQSLADGHPEATLNYLFALEALESVYNAYLKGAFDEN